MPRFVGHMGQRRVDFSIMLCKSIGVVSTCFFVQSTVSARQLDNSTCHTEVKTHPCFECPISFFNVSIKMRH